MPKKKIDARPNVKGDSTLSQIDNILRDKQGNQNTEFSDMFASPEVGPSSSKELLHGISKSETDALHDELDTFRQKWKREFESKQPHRNDSDSENSSSRNQDTDHPDFSRRNISALKESFIALSLPPDNPKAIYALAKKLFLIGVELEGDDQHFESIRYYKQALHLCPDIEKQIFKEQSEATTKSLTKQTELLSHSINNECEKDEEKSQNILVRIQNSFSENSMGFVCCQPASKPKLMHISQLPLDLIMQIFRYVVGQELDLASLECLGLVCRGFYVLSNDRSLWRSICHQTWGREFISSLEHNYSKKKKSKIVDWRHLFISKPRVNFDGIYISRTRYIRLGDVGFQDLTYRPFHMVRYYRYIRFFPGRRVLILTTNEEPNRILPIFRHALHAKQFSPEFSVLEGNYELVEPSQVTIVADKDCSTTFPSQMRHAQIGWSRQTPLAQRFNMRFKLKTVDNKTNRNGPKNSVLEWLEYSILTTMETGQELTKFDMSSDTFPNMSLYRAKRSNLRSTQPLLS